MLSGVLTFKLKHQRKVSQLKDIIITEQWDDFKKIIDSDPFVLFIPQEGITVLQFLCQHGPDLVLKKIIENLTEQHLQKLSKVPKPIDWRPDVLNELMFVASKTENADLLSNCLHLGANGNIPDSLQNRPLHYVMMGKTEAIVKTMADILLKFDVDEHLKNLDSRTAIDVADRAIADWFIQRSRSIRLQELRVVQKKVSHLEAKVEQVEAVLSRVTAKDAITPLVPVLDSVTPRARL